MNQPPPPPTPGDAGAWRHGLPVAVALVVTALLPLGLYLVTMPPTITWWFGGADSGDLASAADALGIPHPTGYPLFVLLGHLATRAPVGEVAGRINAMNAALGATGAAAAAATVLVLERDAPRRTRTATATLAGLALATGGLYWSQAIIGEVYALQAALTALLLWLWARRTTHPLVLGAAHGLMLTNHLTAVIVLGAAGSFLITRSELRSWRWLRPFMLGLAAALLVYALLPLRAAQDPVANWGDPSTPGRFLDHVTGRAYRQNVDWRDVSRAVHALPPLVRLVAGDMAPWVVFAAGAGLVRLARRDRAFAWFSGLLCAGTVLFTAVYRVPDRAPYLLPALVVTAVWGGLGLVDAAEAVRRAWPAQAWGAVAAGGAAAALLLGGWAVYERGRVNLRGDDSALVFARSTLERLPPNATYYSARDDVTFALWYAQRSLGVRRDVQVVDVRNPGLSGVP